MNNTEAYISFMEYIKSTANAVLLFVLCDARGKELNRQVVQKDEIKPTSIHTCTAKFIVDEQLSARMIPGAYTLYMYVGLPKSTALKKDKLAPDDYRFDKCLTEQGVQIRVRGGLQEPSLGTETEAGEGAKEDITLVEQYDCKCTTCNRRS